MSLLNCQVLPEISLCSSIFQGAAVDVTKSDFFENFNSSLSLTTLTFTYPDCAESLVKYHCASYYPICESHNDTKPICSTSRSRVLNDCGDAFNNLIFSSMRINDNENELVKHSGTICFDPFALSNVTLLNSNTCPGKLLYTDQQQNADLLSYCNGKCCVPCRPGGGNYYYSSHLSIFPHFCCYLISLFQIKHCLSSTLSG